MRAAFSPDPQPKDPMAQTLFPRFADIIRNHAGDTARVLAG